MQRLFTVFLTLIFMLSLTACDSGIESESTGAKTEDTITEVTVAQDIPSLDCIRSDAEAALQAENVHASLIDLAIIKSLTDASRYTVTLSLTAQTKYADWEYEVDLHYTKYDQGWMIDSANWTNAQYAQTRIPELTDLTDWATQYLSEHEVYSDVSYSSIMLPMHMAGMSALTAGDTTTVTLTWQGWDETQYGTNIDYFSSEWEYDPEIDNWILVKSNDHGDLGFKLEHDNGDFVGNKNLDFSGEWYDEYDSSRYPQRYDYLIITEYSAQSCVVSVPEIGLESSVFMQIEEAPSFLRFSNGEDQLLITYAHNQVSVSYQIIDNTGIYQSYLSTSYKGSLPTLSE